MSKILAFWGSPRKNGDTAKLMKQVIAGAESVGAEIISYDLNDPNIRGCQGCYYCRTHDGCATKDGLASMYEHMKNADGIVASFPIYFGNIGEQSKQLIDRLYPMLGGDFKPRHPGKKAVTLYAQANIDENLCKTAIDTNNMFFTAFGWELVDSILSYGNSNPEYQIPQELLDRAFKAGKQLVK